MAGPILENLAIPQGSWILVTGVNGHIASHIADQLLRSRELFEKKYKNCKFDLAQVEDATCPGAFDHAIQGISGITHVATIFSGTTDIIESVNNMNQNLLVSAAKEPKMTRFVYTSSSEAAVFSSFLEHDEKELARITVNTWNGKVIERVKRETSSATPKTGVDLYAASKTFGEQAIWQWVTEFQPSFVVNTGK